LVWSSDP